MDELQPTVISERTGPAGLAGIVTINRPEALGALSLGAKEELLAALTDVGADPVSTGGAARQPRAGRSASGQDLRELQAEYASAADA